MQGTNHQYVILTMKMADGATIIRRNRPGTKAKVHKTNLKYIKTFPQRSRNILYIKFLEKIHWFLCDWGNWFHCIWPLLCCTRKCKMSKLTHSTDLHYTRIYILILSLVFNRTFADGPMNRLRKWTAHWLFNNLYNSWSNAIHRILIKY